MFSYFIIFLLFLMSHFLFIWKQIHLYFFLSVKLHLIDLVFAEVCKETYSKGIAKVVNDNMRRLSIPKLF